ncbi:EAL domain-containing protein [bacterium]|nr:EAL domain-containing protein [bacterium]
MNDPQLDASALVPMPVEAFTARLAEDVAGHVRLALPRIGRLHREGLEQALSQDGGEALSRTLLRRVDDCVTGFGASELNEQALDRVALERDLRGALAQRAFHLHYQPKVNAGTGRIVGVEALMRWRHPERGLVSPAEFIPIAEQCGLIIPMTEWVLQTACEQHMDWRRNGLAPVRVSVNLSGRHFASEGLVERVEATLRATGMAPEQLELELTESSLMENVEGAIAQLDALRHSGVTLSLDDFGTGYSSLAYLKRFPIQTLKIDQSFVRDLPNSRDDAAIVSTIIAMARSLGLDTVAEGVEAHEQVAFLRAMGCRIMQGYRFYRPLSPEILEELLPRAAAGAGFSSRGWL